ncbi:MAG: PAAR domain-containing protein [Proteobacteria bacterium]|nr:PAAR domain-containing protein [Pseudomonadota bacterium]
MSGFAARLGDPTAHGSPLVPGPPSPNVFIGGQPAWLGMTAAAAAALAATIAEGVKDVADKTAKAAAAASLGPAASAKAQKDLVEAQKNAVSNATSAMTGSGASINTCPMLTVLIPHVMGVVTAPSPTVFINGLGACRVGDIITEATAVNSIAMGLPTVIIGP